MQFRNLSLLLFMVCLGTTVSAQKYLSANTVEISKEWEGNNFTSTKSFAENIAEAPQFKILSKLLKNNPLQQKLENEEMVTIFAFTDTAFLQLSKKSRDSIINNSKLMNAMVKYLTVPGRVDSYTLKTAVEKNNGTIYLKTLDGQKLGIRESNGKLQLVDSEKRTATIIASDFYHKNGFFHIVEGLIFPASED
ncbi:MAG: fasciclin domain-containing protein [Flavobacteriaceae bacterium]|nr:fasciclin domain-containing protein [Flavobacteriaceae bacterium]